MLEINKKSAYWVKKSPKFQISSPKFKGIFFFPLGLGIWNLGFGILIFTTLYPLSNIHSQPQDEEFINPQAVNNIIKTNPLAILWGSIPLTAEYRVMIELTSSRNQSNQIGISYLGKSPVLKLFEDSIEELNLLIVRGIRFQASHKFYINKLGDLLGLPYSEYAPHGLYISPHLSYSTAKFSTKFLNSRDVFIKGTHFNVNLLAGYQLIRDFWALDFFAGLGYKKNTWIEQDQQNSININTSDFGKFYNSPVKLNLGFNVGVVF